MAATASIERIPLDLIDFEANIRADLGELDELAASIRKLDVLQPVILEPKGDGRYKVIAGHRRCAAAKQAGKADIPTTFRQAGEAAGERVAIQLIENVQREDLKPSELATALDALLKCRNGTGKRLYSQDSLAKEFGLSQARVSKTVALLKLPEDVRAPVDSGRIGVEDGYELSKLARWHGRMMRALSAGTEGGSIAAAVKRELAEQQQEDKRARIRADLEAHGIAVAPGGWQEKGRYLHALGLDLEAHRPEPCHAALVEPDGSVAYVCLDAARHAPASGAGGAPSGNGKASGKARGAKGTAAGDKRLAASGTGKGHAAARQEPEPAAAGEAERVEEAALRRAQALKEAAEQRATA